MEVVTLPTAAFGNSDGDLQMLPVDRGWAVASMKEHWKRIFAFE